MLEYIQDPGHGWLKVSPADLDDVNLSYVDFTAYSYTNGHYLYLEEDCDMTKFMNVYKVKHERFPDLIEIHMDPCFVRDLPANPVDEESFREFGLGLLGLKRQLKK